jgi:hypothetical protein
MSSEEIHIMDIDEGKLGGGSGGDTGMAGDAGNQIKSAKATYQIGGNQVYLVSRKAIPGGSNPPGPSKIALLAGGSPEAGFIDDGEVDVRGCKAVRITSGPLAIPMVSPSTSSESTDGIDLITSITQKIRLQHGITPEINQRIELTTDGILIDAGMLGTLTLRAGLSEITIDMSGITIIGCPFVQINPGPPAPPAPMDEPDLPPLPAGEAYA